MAEENEYLILEQGVIPPDIKYDDDLWFVFCNNRMLIKNDEDDTKILNYIDARSLDIDYSAAHYIGSYNGINCYTLELKSEIKLNDNIMFSELRPLAEVFNEEFFFLCGRAYQIINWDRDHKYCGRCGSLTDNKEGERAKVCPNCGFISYPRLSPAIIVAIVKEGKILLAHNAQFKNGRYSVIAGFVEPGETFEDCVKREILEEVGIRVKNIKYFASQPWPFPNSLMIAFTAEYLDGEIKVDGIEIDDANWYSPSEIPNVPTKVSVAGKLIHWFLGNYE